MSWVSGPPFGGESRDAASETISVIRSSDVAIDSTAARLQLHPDGSPAGARCLKFLTATNASKAIVPAFGVDTAAVSTKILAFSFAIGSTLPTSDLGIISNATQGGARYLRQGTDGTLRFHDSGGVEIGPRSRTVVSTTGATECTVFYDFISFTGASATRAIIRLYIGDKEELMFLADTQSANTLMETTVGTITLGEWLPAATNRGADFFLDDAFPRYSTSIHDSPHLTPYPRPRLVGCAPPTAEGGTSDWASTTAGPNSFQDVDEYPNDGATTIISTLTESAKHLFTSSAANPVPSTAAVLYVGLCQVGDVAGAGKLANNMLLRDASANETSASLISAPATTMVGQRAVASGVQGLARPAGGTWVYTDFDLSGGVSNLQFGVVASAIPDASPRVSNISSPYIAVSTHNLEAGGYPGRGAVAVGGLSPLVL